MPDLTTTHSPSTGTWRAELYKLRAHRTPAAVAGILLLGVLAPSAVLLWYTPDSAMAYTETWSTVFAILGPLTAIVYGGWLVGTEYKQGTMKRMLTTEPRRLRALGAKATAGVSTLAFGLVGALGLGWAAAWVVGDLNGVSVPFETRELLATVVTSVLFASVAFGLATLTRNGAFGMVATTGLLLVLDPLISLIPTVGDYTLGSVIGVVDEAISGETSPFDTASIATTTAVAALAAWMGGLGLTTARLFARRDV